MIKKDKSYIDDSSPILYFIATPIGNLKDITLRALELLQQADIIACEDTRNTKKLLSFYQIDKPLFSLHEHNEISAANCLIEKIKQNQRIVYVSDAGYPIISDPGQILAKICLQNNIKISIIPGASAFLMGLLGSNIDAKHFYFYGFLSPKANERIKQLKSLQSIPDTLIFYESPHRIKQTLDAIKQIFPNRQICIARELSKIHEEYIRLNTNEINQINFDELIGEMVIIVQGRTQQQEIDKAFLIDEIKFFLKQGNLKDKETAKLIADRFNLSKNYIYDLILEIKNKQN